MLADRVRMILGRKKDMKTYKIKLSNGDANKVSYLNFQEDSVGLIGNYLTRTFVEYEVTRYVPIALKYEASSPPIVRINGTHQNLGGTQIQAVAHIRPGGTGSPSVSIYDLEAISTISGIPIEDMETLEFMISFH